jgi:hypothetical protein
MAGPAVNRGLVGWWPLNDGAGNRINDLTGRTVGVNNGGVWGAGRNSGKSLQVAGTSTTAQYVNLGTPNTLNLHYPCTVSAWIYPTSFGVTSTNGTIFSIGYNGANTQIALVLSYPSGLPSWSDYVPPSSSVGVTGPTAVPLNAWTHLAGVITGTQWILYVNGKYAASTASTVVPPVTGQPIGIGGVYSSGAGWSQGFIGRISDVRVFNVGLSGGEIWQVYKGAVQGNPLRAFDGRSTLTFYPSNVIWYGI